MRGYADEEEYLDDKLEYSKPEYHDAYKPLKEEEGGDSYETIHPVNSRSRKDSR
jgi:hypothetical protein